MDKRLLLLVVVIVACVRPADADLHDPANSADYLIVTTAQLFAGNPWIGQLAQWRESHGRTAKVVATDSIWNEFGSGTPSDSVLREFLHYARLHWQPPQLKDVFIVGDHSIVPSHVETDSQLIVQPDTTYWRLHHYVSDLFLARAPSSEELLPVLNIGRLPWNPPLGTPLWNYYAKVHGYETAPSESWQTRIHLIADYTDNYFNYWQDFAEPVAALVPQGYAIERDYPDYPMDHPWHGDHDDIRANLNAGSYLTCFVGQGGAGVWSGRILLRSETVDSLTNGHRLPIVIPMGYDFDMYSTYQVYPMAASFISNPNGGAIGYFAHTNYSWVILGYELGRMAVSQALSDSAETLGDIWRRAVADFILAHADQVTVPLSPYRWEAFGCMLLGDPGLRLPPRPQSIGPDARFQPRNIRLLGNYPNPFNSATRIEFELNRAAHVELCVLNTLGQTVATLIDQELAAGRHGAVWEADRQASGLYFAVLTTNSSGQVHKMVLLR